MTAGDDVLIYLNGLLQQAAVERSHYYTAEGLRRAIAEITLLRAMLATTTEDLSEWVEEHYRDLKDRPDGRRRYERDMSNVRTARKILREYGSLPSS
jgi:hypothetical protein